MLPPNVFKLIGFAFCAFIFGMMVSTISQALGMSIACGVPAIVLLIMVIAGTKHERGMRPDSIAIPLTNNLQQGSATFSDDSPGDKYAHIGPNPTLPHAEKALEIAQPSPAMLNTLRLIDIGFIAYWDEQTAYTYRTTAIPDGVESLLPYARIYLNYGGLYNFSFELRDFSGKLFLSRGLYTSYDAKQHLIVPKERIIVLPIFRVSVWTLGFLVNGELVAEHRFTWREKRVEQIETVIEADGEINAEMRHAVHEAKPISLDDLLADGDESAGRRQSDE